MSGKAEYSRIGATEARAIDRFMSDVFDSGEPARAIADIIARGSLNTATAFERYAATVLRTAGAQRLENMSRARAIQVIRPENGRLAQLVHAGTLPHASEAAILAAECALNRLVCIADAIADGIQEGDKPHGNLRRSISILGGGYLAPTAGWRSTRVKLPPFDASEGVTPAYYNEVDWRATDCVASNARAVFQRSMRPNAYRTKLSVRVDHQSDWDVRTRLAQIVGALELPYRCSFRFDYDSAAKSVAAVFTCPPTSFLPAVLTDAHADGSPSLERAYETYLIRLACLFGAACFGSSGAMSQATVVGYNATWNRPLVAAQFERDDFVRSVLVPVDSGEFSKPEYRFEPKSVACMITASHLDWMGQTESRGVHKIALPDLDMRKRVPEPWLDERNLPDEAQRLFRCERLCDTDTSHYYGGHADAVDLAREDVDESPLASVLRLESLVEELERQFRPPDNALATRPLYAAHPLARLAIGLLDDERAISAQAEAFLHGGELPPRIDGGAPRYYRAPDALFHARFGLSDLYQSMGDYSGAERQADSCISLAPTTASAYYRKADVLAEQGLFDQAANILIAGLAYSTTHQDSSLLYFHLAMLFWNMGRKDEAAAVHVYNASLKGEYANRSAQVVQGMRTQGLDLPILGMSAIAAKEELKRLHLPIAPIDLRQQILQATVALTNAGSPTAAAPYARELERFYRKDDIVTAACRSIQHGINLPPQGNLASQRR